jgi:tetratricopeptide (TPR) repeat protein
MAKDLALREAKMLRASFGLIGGLLSGAFLLLAVMATGVQAGMSQDLASCTAAKNRGAAAACTRVMESGRLPREQMYIGYFNRGTAHRRAGDFDKAVADFTKVLELKPGFPRAYEARAMTEDDRGNREKARADIDEAIKRDGKAWQFLYSRAVLLRADGDVDGALRDLDAAGDLKPDAANIPLMRGLVLADKGSYAAAREEINGVLSEGRGGASALYARAAVAFEEGRLEAAEEDADRALELDGDFAAAHMLKGRILEERGDAAAARARFNKALNGAADSFDGRTTRRIAKQRTAVGAPAKDKVAVKANDKAKPKRDDDLAEVQLPRKPLDCKVFLPATGTVVTAKCNE